VKHDPTAIIASASNEIGKEHLRTRLRGQALRPNQRALPGSHSME